MPLRHVPNVSPLARIVTSSMALLVALLLLAGCGGDGQDGPEEASPPTGFNAERAFADVRRQVAIGPRPAGSAASRRLTRLLAADLRRAGVDQVSVGRPLRNVVGTIPGDGEGWVVVGAHHDTKDDAGPEFVGANDGASGVAVVLELARALPNPMPGPGIAIALFDAEEARGSRPFERDGTRGSRRYVAQAEAGGKGAIPALGQIRAMVLFDMVGDCDLQLPREANSDPGLYELFERAAGGAPFGGTTGPISDDHVPFLRAGVRALDLIDFTYGPGGTPGAWWHTEEDTLDKVCAASLGAVGDAAIRALPEIR
jgi:glutaminyl-peptide cyclotransferase